MSRERLKTKAQDETANRGVRSWGHAYLFSCLERLSTKGHNGVLAHTVPLKRRRKSKLTGSTASTTAATAASAASDASSISTRIKLITYVLSCG
jgi:hypothetical protein